ncbi:unnamed protein product [Durusdinium trenchii]|uniref:Uncharacterized protein n=1 Tax=Durusdinium trenchii TaxID=1381693 RepID=A0ABP0K072_9DINO
MKLLLLPQFFRAFSDQRVTSERRHMQYRVDATVGYQDSSDVHSKLNALGAATRFKEPMPFEMLQAMLYRTFVELAEGTKEASPLPGASALPLSLPRKAVLLLLDAVAPPLPPLGPSGATARRTLGYYALSRRIELRYS